MRRATSIALLWFLPFLAGVAELCASVSGGSLLRVGADEPPVPVAGVGVVQPVIRKEYDQNGNVLAINDPNGHRTRNTYDALNHLETTIDAEGDMVSYGYDAVGNRTSVTDGNGHVTNFAYDGLKRNTKVTDGVGNATTFNFDGVNKTSRIDAMQQVATYGYDLRNRVTGVTYPGRAVDNRGYSYYPTGHLHTVTEPEKSGLADVAYTYDTLYRVSTELSNGVTHAYRYDLAGNRIGTIYGATGRTLVGVPDNLNRIGSITEQPPTGASLTTTYGFDLDGNVVSEALPNGDLIATGYDALSRAGTISGTNTQSGAFQYSYANGYDAAGNVVSIGETYGGMIANRTVANEYDHADRLKTETATTLAVGGNPGGVTATGYTYDGASNRTGKTVTTGDVFSGSAYGYNSLNQLTTVTATGGSQSYQYDSNGNRTERTAGMVVTKYQYDSENRLIWTGDGQHSYAYVYDYRTRRVERREDTVTTDLVFSGGESVQERAGGLITAEYVRGSDRGGGIGGILYTIRSTGPRFAHYDGRGDVTTETAGDGTVTYQAAYEAYGKRPEEAGATLDRQKANTKEEDPTGLLNENMRYRDLDTGTFITADPSGFVDGPNLYCYVRQNPWTKFDPEGLNSWEDFKSSVQNGAKAALNVSAGAIVGYEQVVVGVGQNVHPSSSAQAVGLNIGRAAGMVQAVGEMVQGTAAAVEGGGAAVGSAGTLSEIGVPVAVAGAAEAAHGVYAAQNGLKLGFESVSKSDASSSGSCPEGSAKETGEQTQTEVHGNSKESTKPQHTYDIIETESETKSGELHKTGISGEDLNKNGTSGRANRQVNQLNKEAGYDKYHAEVTETNIPGRKQALAKEQARVDEHASTHGGEGPRGNIRPAPTQ